MKYANAIVVGGPIAVGKSTLVAALPFAPVPELTTNDQLQQLLLSAMYQGDVVAPQIFQLDMMLLRFERYAQLANRPALTVFDRSIFEDYFFASVLLKTAHPQVFAFYEALWLTKVHSLLSDIGAPRLYLLLTCNWVTFQERIFKRGRAAEIDNFNRNEAYFRHLIEHYELVMRNLLARFNLPYVVIATDGLDSAAVLDAALAALVQHQLLIEVKHG